MKLLDLVEKNMQVEIDETWISTLLCVVNDSIMYNDSLQKSKTVKDVEDIKEWMMSIY
ncbi:MAG: hypothetical protein PVI97_12155 [Candidatus Thiodiazotropha sp.]|jgi:hypothetical protein